MSSLIHTEGIVLKSQKYGETSMIAQVLTREHGIISLIMGSVTSANSRKGMFQIMNQLDLVIYYQERKTMHRIKEVRYHTIYQSLPFEIQRSAVGVFILELIRKSLREHEKDTELYDWIKYCLTTCDENNNQLTYMPLYFIIGLARHLGFCPLMENNETDFYFDLREGCFVRSMPFHKDILDATYSNLLCQLLDDKDFTEWSSYRIDKNDRKILLYALLDYYKIHLDHFNGLDSPYILEEILAA